MMFDQHSTKLFIDNLYQHGRMSIRIIDVNINDVRSMMELYLKLYYPLIAHDPMEPF